MKKSKTRPKQTIELRKRIEEFLQKNPAAIKKITPEDVRNLFEDLQIYQTELEKYNNELQKVHKQLQDSEEKYRQLFATISDAIMVFDAETKEFIDANDAVSSFYGYTKEEFLELKQTDITAELKKSDDSIKKTVSGEISSIPLRYHKRKDGTIFPVEISTGAFTLGKRQMVFGVARDITERKQAEEALQESEERFRTICESAQDSIFLKDLSLKYTHVNPAMESLFQLPAQELIGKSDEEIFGEEAGSHIRKVDSRVLAGEIIQEEHTKPVGEIPITFHVIKVPIRDNSGKIVGLCGIARDITERKQAEEMLQKAHDELEMKVEERTAELVMSMNMLEKEIEERKRAELAIIERGKDLENKTHELEEVNAALKVLLKHRDEDKKDFEEKIVANVKKLVFPYVEKLHNSQLNDRQIVYLNIIKSNLVDIIAPFLHQLSSKYSDLTPNEIQIAGLVKDGKTTKEIAKLLNSSTGTIDFHRNNLRKKLGLLNTKTNLRSFLLSLT
jgi:PAS domain S-box-containing protein